LKGGKWQEESRNNKEKKNRKSNIKIETANVKILNKEDMN
jgi:hypothetical protein